MIQLFHRVTSVVFKCHPPKFLYVAVGRADMLASTSVTY